MRIHISNTRLPLVSENAVSLASNGKWLAINSPRFGSTAAIVDPITFDVQTPLFGTWESMDFAAGNRFLVCCSGSFDDFDLQILETERLLAGELEPSYISFKSERILGVTEKKLWVLEQSNEHELSVVEKTFQDEVHLTEHVPADSIFAGNWQCGDRLYYRIDFENGDKLLSKLILFGDRETRILESPFFVMPGTDDTIFLVTIPTITVPFVRVYRGLEANACLEIPVLWAEYVTTKLDVIGRFVAVVSRRETQVWSIDESKFTKFASNVGSLEFIRGRRQVCAIDPKIGDESFVLVSFGEVPIVDRLPIGMSGRILGVVEDLNIALIASPYEASIVRWNHSVR